MFRFLLKLLQRQKKREKQKNEENNNKLYSELSENMRSLRDLFRNDNDFVAREFVIGTEPLQNGGVVYIDGLASATIINDSILTPLMRDTRLMQVISGDKTNTGDMIREFITAGEIKSATTINEVAEACLAGDAVILIDGEKEAVIVNAKGFEKRSVSEPETENVIRGPREGFTEVLRVNTSLLRRKLRSTDLRMELLTIGRRSATAVCLSYIDGIANPELIAEVKRRLSTIDTDAILSSGYIEEFIEDAPASVFPTIAFSEKPDIVASKLLEGRCALIIDGTPFVLTMPMLFVENFQSPEDYTGRAYFATFMRIIRAICFFVSLAGPAIYIALTTFHHELLPTPLLFTIAASREGLPFPAAIETALMLLTFEILNEAGVRLPKPVGQAISIVGALVMGQAAIQAGIVGAPVVIVIAFSAVATFISPHVSNAISLLRWYLLVLAAAMGGFGIAIGLFTILVHLASLESFGSVYMTPIAPLYPPDLKDSFIRVPLWFMRRRPKAISPADSTRQNMSKPIFPHSSEGN